jgi:hypothetical protein
VTRMQQPIESACSLGRDLTCRCDSKPFGDILFDYCLKKLSCAPLEPAAAAFAGLGLLLTAVTSEKVSPTRLQPSTCLRGLQSSAITRAAIYVAISPAYARHVHHTIRFLHCSRRP